jgi:hypothetical protein
MNNLRKLCQAIAAFRLRSPRQKGAAGNYTRARVATVMTALALPLLAGLLTASSASAGTGPALQLGSNSYGDWVASGSSYASGLSDVQVWLQNVTNGGWTTVEYQSGVHTSVRSVTCSNHSCLISPGGILSAQGASYWVSVPPGGFGYPGYWQAEHPLACGHSYEAVTYDPSDGWVYSNVLTEPACPVIQ